MNTSELVVDDLIDMNPVHIHFVLLSSSIGSMSNYPLFMVRSWNNMVRGVCLSIFLWIRDTARLLLGTSVSWWYLPQMWASVTDMQNNYHARYPTDYWHLAFMFSLVYFFPSKRAWKAYFPIMLAQDEIPASGSVHPSRWLRHLRENKIEQGMTRLSTWAKWGGIWNDAWVYLRYWVVI